MREERLDFYKENGQKIAAKAFIPEGEGKKYPVVIFAHGFNGNYKTLQHHGEGFAEAGIVCLFFDFCGGGMESESDGLLKEMTVITEVEDLKVVMNEVAKLPYIDEDNMFLQGESQGGFVSAYVAAEVPEKVKALVLWYPALVIPDDSKRRFEEGDNKCFDLELSPDYNIVAKDIDIFEKIKGYKGPVKLIHGDMDPIVPISYSQRALEAYENASLEIIPQAGHGFDGEDSANARKYSIEFVRSVLANWSV